MFVDYLTDWEAGRLGGEPQAFETQRRVAHGEGAWASLSMRVSSEKQSIDLIN
ncbi:hypothetical protein [Verticiella sediminum]|uniref:hypothetical protein n=1 Tax=Verticiella sediminum TaxID=1247510 RepID=UPI001478095D|nr:hypothetical protein [Verticiella sediminum]